MESREARIPARSRRQAMEWSLVLVSQGIETTIDQSGEDGQWGLFLPATDFPRAIDALRKYRIENREWPWRQTVPGTEAKFDWLAILWAGLLMAMHWLAYQGQPNLSAVGAMDSRAVSGGQGWRIFTAIMLHADLAHLAANLAIGTCLWGLAMGRYGAGVALLASYLAGAAGNVASLLINPKPFVGLGCSGMVTGTLGLLAALPLTPAHRKGKPLWVLAGEVAGGVMLFVLVGLAEKSDIAAHAGGFAAGLAMGSALVFVPEKRIRNGWVNLAAAVVLTAIASGAWHLALK